MDLTHYTKWDENQTKYAIDMADDLFLDYIKDGVTFQSYKVDNEPKSKELYCLEKMSCILYGSGILMEYKVYQKKGYLRVEVYLAPK